MSKELETKIVQILWPRMGIDNPRNWYRLECLTKTGSLVCTGNIPWRPIENELLKLTGEFVVWKGQQCFKFTDAKPNVPVDLRMQLAYVVERTKGMGYVAEEAIWEQYGENWKELTAKEAEELKIRTSAYENFRQQIENLSREQEKCETVSYLLGRQCSNAIACAAWEKWENKAIGIINSNCYRLTELRGFGFSDIDGKIRTNYEIKDDDPRRISAAIIYAMKQLTSSGSTVVAWAVLVQKLTELKINLALASQTIGAMFNEYILRGFEQEQMLALGTHYNAEMEILNFTKDTGNVSA